MYKMGMYRVGMYRMGMYRMGMHRMHMYRVGMSDAISQMYWLLFCLTSSEKEKKKSK